ncbi:hypothetical protein LJR230_004548 [Trinickia sp. LjRoot230]|uniref:hypothetical protein n=1 Tax=Trinickia sp. LjRoot230 TaxID=3342288 RepID=UPI003ECE2290
MLKFIAAVMSDTTLLALSKGRYERLVAEYLRALNIDVSTSKTAPTGTLFINRKLVRFKYMRDAAISHFVAHKLGRMGFAGSHQVLDARVHGTATHLNDLPVLKHPSARFAVAARPEKMNALAQKLRDGETVTLSTEYVSSARQIALQCGWSVNFYRSDKGMAEIDAGEHPEFIDGVAAIVDTKKTLRNNDLDVVEDLDHLAPIWIHVMWRSRPDLATTEHRIVRGVLPERGPRNEHAIQTQLNAWLDGRHAATIRASLRRHRYDEMSPMIDVDAIPRL